MGRTSVMTTGTASITPLSSQARPAARPRRACSRTASEQNARKQTTACGVQAAASRMRPGSRRAIAAVGPHGRERPVGERVVEQVPAQPSVRVHRQPEFRAALGAAARCCGAAPLPGPGRLVHTPTVGGGPRAGVRPDGDPAGSASGTTRPRRSRSGVAVTLATNAAMFPTVRSDLLLHGERLVQPRAGARVLLAAYVERAVEVAADVGAHRVALLARPCPPSARPSGTTPPEWVVRHIEHMLRRCCPRRRRNSAGRGPGAAVQLDDEVAAVGCLRDRASRGSPGRPRAARPGRAGRPGAWPRPWCSSRRRHGSLVRSAAS